MQRRKNHRKKLNREKESRDCDVKKL